MNKDEERTDLSLARSINRMRELTERMTELEESMSSLTKYTRQINQINTLGLMRFQHTTQFQYALNDLVVHPLMLVIACHTPGPGVLHYIRRSPDQGQSWTDITPDDITDYDWWLAYDPVWRTIFAINMPGNDIGSLYRAPTTDPFNPTTFLVDLSTIEGPTLAWTGDSQQPIVFSAFGRFIFIKGSDPGKTITIYEVNDNGDITSQQTITLDKDFWSGDFAQYAGSKPAISPNGQWAIIAINQVLGTSDRGYSILLGKIAGETPEEWKVLFYSNEYIISGISCNNFGEAFALLQISNELGEGSFAVSSPNKVIETKDFGSTWTTENLQPEEIFGTGSEPLRISSFIAPDGSYFMFGERRVFWSPDKGGTWTHIFEGDNTIMNSAISSDSLWLGILSYGGTKTELFTLGFGNPIGELQKLFLSKFDMPVSQLASNLEAITVEVLPGVAVTSLPSIPTGDNWIGKIKIGDGTNLLAIPQAGDSIGRGVFILGSDYGGTPAARVVKVDSSGRLSCVLG